MIVNPIYLQGAYILGAYLLGSIPFGLLVADLLGGGKDPREVGSGNIGATNVSRAVGKAGGILTLLLDAGKGFIPLFLARWIFPETQYSLFSMVALAAFLGHIFPLYLKFKGGKGVATAFGIAVFISPVAALLLIVIFIVALVITGYVSVGSLSSAFCFPLLIALLGPSRVYIALALIMAFTVFYTHRENIRKLIEGRENRFIKKP